MDWALGEFKNNFELDTIATLGGFDGRLVYSSGLYNSDIQHWHASASYAFNDRLSGMVNYSVLDTTDYNIASVGLSYDVEERVSLTASATDLASLSTRQRTYALGVGLNF